MADILFGRWAVLEALRAKRRDLQQVLLVEGIEEKGVVSDVIAEATERGLSVKRVPRRMVV